MALALGFVPLAMAGESWPDTLHLTGRAIASTMGEPGPGPGPLLWPALTGLTFPAETASTNEPASQKSFWRDLLACDDRSDRKWSFEFGVAVISDNTPADYTEPKLNKLHGPGGGETYNFTVARRIHQFEWSIGSVTLRPQLEVPARLTLVDENTGRLIPDLNLGLVLRWRDFPWNRLLRTTLAAGPGLSYSFQVWTADFQRHEEDEERSRLKFWLPIEFTVALPWYPRHQLVAFIDHQSGGTLFDRGGVDAWGLGYRFEF
jgi:hypothetical protein